jgi:hypothetical protein
MISKCSCGRSAKSWTPNPKFASSNPSQVVGVFYISVRISGGRTDGRAQPTLKGSAELNALPRALKKMKVLVTKKLCLV